MIPLRFYTVVSLILGIFSFSYLSAQSDDCTFRNNNLLVTNTNDSGSGSLRAAIECANAIAGPNRIVFDIDGTNQHVIFVGQTTGEPLPALSDENTIIDATTQVGATTEPRIVLDGRAVQWELPVNGLFILADNCEVLGLEIRYFPDDGIDIFGANNVRIGRPRRGNVIYGCGEERDFYDTANPSGPWEGCGIVLRGGANFCQIQSNLIGTDKDLTSTFPNEYAGILIRGNSSNNVIGGSEEDALNIIAFNQVGVQIDGSVSCAMFTNAMLCNKRDAIFFRNGGNQNKLAPIITTASTEAISGTAEAGDFVEIFVNKSSECGGDPCQGRVFVTRVVARQDGTWSLDTRGISFGDFDIVTATATNASGNTSDFANCRRLNSLENNCAEADGTIWVTNTNDDGDGSLRAAIECANSTPGANTIRFNIPGTGRQIIYVSSTTGQPLPPLTDAETVIDASTQTGFGQNGNFEPVIVIDGSEADWDIPYNAIWVQGDNCEVYALEVRNFPDDGIDVSAASGVIIGAPNKGNVIYNCGVERDIFSGANPDRPWEGCGIILKNGSSNCKVSSNIIGTNYDKTLDIGNENCGIAISNRERSHIIGGTNLAEGNYIAHNPMGIEVRTGATQISMLKNTFTCNDTIAIALRGTANANKQAPVINQLTTVGTSKFLSGTADPNDQIELYLSSTLLCPEKPCQGQVYLGNANADATGAWELTVTGGIAASIPSDGVITALATDAAGNTSAFANCYTNQLASCEEFQAAIANRRNETCDNANGAFSIAVEGGTAPYTYDIGTGPTLSPDFTNLDSGTYSVTITDANGCIATQATAINSLAPPTVFVVDTVSATCGQQTGAFTILPFGGVPPFQYDIGDGFTTNNRFDQLAPGTYEITLSDATGCETIETVEVNEIASIDLTIGTIEDASCGENNGVAVGVIDGGIEPIVYDLGPLSSSTSRFENLAPGAYTMIATDANGCTATHSFTIDATPPLSLSIANVEDADCAQASGQITVTTIGGTPPILYDYGNGITANPIFSNLNPGTYLITATDANGCESVQSARVSSEGNLDVEVASQIDASCGENNGAFTVSVVAGQAPFSFDLGQGVSDNNTFTDLGAGNYQLTITDNSGCLITQDIVINEIPPLGLEVLNIINANCSAGGGAFSVFASGGTLPITFSIGDNETSNPFFSDLAAGSYTITATDANGCQATQSIEIDLIGTLELAAAEVVDATCGLNNGRITVNPISGRSPYQYQLGGTTVNSSIITNLAAGTYEIIVTDAVGCSATQTITIEEQGGVEANILSSTIANCAQSIGQFEVEVTSGMPPYRYDIGNGEQGEPIFTNLSGGTYEVTIIDANDCEATQSVTIEETPPITTEIANQNNTSCGLENGLFSINVRTGTAPYTFEIGNETFDNGNFENLSAGTYEVVITDANDCSTVEVVTIEEGTSTIEAIASVDVIASCGQSIGSFEVTATGGVEPYTYSIGNGDQTEPIFTNLSGGDYEYTITDATGCTFTSQIEIEETPPITATIENQSDAKCGEDNARFDVVVTSGTPPYSYNIGNGVVSNPTFTNLPSGFYTVTITDANFCTTTESVGLDESLPLSVNIEEKVIAKCGAANGAFTAAVTGGTAPYTYSIGTASTNDPTFENLSGGNYELTITDSQGCEEVVEVEIEQTNTITAQLVSQTIATCGQENASIEITVEGGQVPYEYIIDDETYSESTINGLGVGTYNVTVSDAFDCSTNLQVTIEENSNIQASVEAVQDDSCGEGSGAFTIAVSAGTAPYTFTWENGTNENGIFTNVAAGNYNVTATDAAGCQAIVQVDIEAGTDLELTVLNQQAPTCSEANGVITVSANGGIEPYSFSIGNGTSTSSTFNGLSSGDYTVEVIDGNGCVSEVEINLTSPDAAPVVSIVNQLDVSCRLNNGSFELQVEGGATPYTYDMGDGTTNNPIFTDLSEGTYVVTITDDKGCEVMQEVTIGSVDELIVKIENLENASCEQANGQFTVTPEGGAAPYTYNIGNGATNNPTFTNLAEGIYTVTVVDSRNCEEIHVATVSQDEPIRTSIVNRADANCGASSGAFTVIVFGGTEPYQYDIGAGVTGNNRFENLESGNYELTITDDKGCELSTAIQVAGSDAPTASIGNIQATSCGETNGSFTIEATGGAAPYTYDIGNGAVVSPTFQDLNGGDYIVSVTDANGCSTEVSATIETNDGNAPDANFLMETVGVIVELVDDSENGSILSWNLGDGTSYEGTNVIHEYAAAGTYNICLTVSNDCGEDTYCESVTLEEISSVASVSGWVRTELEEPISEVNVRLSNIDPEQTDGSGTYNFDALPMGVDYTIAPEKRQNILNGVSTFDLFLINNHILTTQPLDSPYKIIAADIDRSGAVTTFDVLILRKLLLGVETELPEGQTSWRFIPSDFEFPDPTRPLRNEFPEYININDLNDNIANANFIGVKIGDVNNNAILERSVTIEQRASQIMALDMLFDATRNEYSFEVPTNVMSLQFTVAVDPSQAIIADLEIGNLEGLSLANFGLNQIAEGLFTLSWHRSGSSEGNRLMKLQLKSTKEIDPETVIKLTSTITKAEAVLEVDGKLKAHHPTIQFLEKSVPLLLHANTPNPFTNYTDIHFTLPASDEVTVQVMNESGQLLTTIKQTLEAGEQSIRIQEQNLSVGVLYYRLSTTKESVVGKMIRVD